MNNAVRLAAIGAIVLACCPGVSAVEIETITVGDPGNAGELSGESAPGGDGPDRICGTVDYIYNIGKFEVTAGQYTEFLNAVADDDIYGLYNTKMGDPSGWGGCNVQRSGSSGSYTYSVAGTWADRPVKNVSWGDAARFCNWLHHGQPTGTQQAATTENGSYDLSATQSYYGPDGQTPQVGSDDWHALKNALLAIVREPDATWVIPSEDEWYKAAYYDGGSGVYYNYPTGTNAVPNNGYPEGDTGNSANFFDGDYTIGSPYWRTEVGFFGLSASPYGTFDQGGNAAEWNEAVFSRERGARGGSYRDRDSYLRAADRADGANPTLEGSFGFRVARLHERAGNLIDFAALQRCFGPEPDALCRTSFDCDDADGQIDLDDYAVLYARLSGLDAPPCGMVIIPAGEFEMGDAFSEALARERPVHTVFLSTYSIGAYEVTNQQYADGLNWALGQGLIDNPYTYGGMVYDRGGEVAYCDTYSTHRHSRIRWNGTTFTVTTGKEDHPMVLVSWYGSVAYCNWRSTMEGRPACYDLSTWTCDFGVAGYRLPTEAEWEKAARGGAAGHRFSWSHSDTIQHAWANFYSAGYAGGDPVYPYDTSPSRGYHPIFNTGVYPYTSPVGYFTPNGYGVHDTTGNVLEWCNDWYLDEYYSSSPGSNPTGAATGKYRATRGGSWNYYPYECRSAFRFSKMSPNRRSYHHGFRLALGSE